MMLNKTFKIAAPFSDILKIKTTNQLIKKLSIVSGSLNIYMINSSKSVLGGKKPLHPGQS